MTVSPWPTDRDQQLAEVTADRDSLAMEARFLRETLEESLTGLETEDRGWLRMTSRIHEEITGTARVRLVETCRMSAIANPLLKGGLMKRIGYIWGQGIEISARIPADEGEEPDQTVQDAVNQVIDAFEKLNKRSLMGMKAHESKERALGTDGEVFLALFTDTRAGEVRVRAVPQLEIIQIVTNPEDSEEPWFYYREYTYATLPRADVENVSMQPTDTAVVRTLYPALGFDPKAAGYGFRPPRINGIDVMWDAPMVHVAVNQLDGWERGIPDVYAALAWARMYQEFLVDWAGLTKALSKIAWKATGDTKSRAEKVAAAERRRQGQNGPGVPAPPAVGASSAGGTVVAGPGTDLTAVSKSGATIDAESGKPLAAMVAAGIGLPVTMLLADPGISGARATAQTLDTPTILEMGMRRLVWQSALEDILRYAIEVAANAPGGAAMQGVEPVIDFAWPPIAGMDPVQLVAAIVQADSTEKMPPLTTARLLLSALGVPDVDEILTKYTDAEGNFVPPEGTMKANAGSAATDAFRRGQDPAEALR